MGPQSDNYFERESSLAVNPTVSVILPVYNGEKYLKEAVDSLFRQTFTDFEVIAIDDGSTDRSFEVLSSFRDSRLRIIRLSKNEGLISALNHGIAQARGEYLARMDADDIALPMRFSKQVDFLRRNKSVTFCGTGFVTVGGGWFYETVGELDPQKVRADLFFFCAFLHSSMMWRRTANFSYSYELPFVEDWNAWLKVSRKFEMATIQDILMVYRRHPDTVEAKQGDRQREGAYALVRASLEELLGSPSQEQIEIQQRIYSNDLNVSAASFSKLNRWLLVLREKNFERQLFDAEQFEINLYRSWVNFALRATPLGLDAYREFIRSPLSQKHASYIFKCKYLLACLLRKDLMSPMFIRKALRFSLRAFLIWMVCRIQMSQIPSAKLENTR